MIPSPFFFGGALAPDRLIDRREQLRDIVTNLQDGGRLFLIGPRRFGKTSLLLAARREAGARGLKTVMVNAEGHLTLDGLAERLIVEAGNVLGESLREKAGNLVKWLAALKPSVSYDPMTDSLSASVTAAERGPQATNIAEALDLLDRIAGERRIRLGVIIDEFQEVTRREGFGAEKVLRARVQEHQNLSYVFSGSDTSLMSAMVMKHNRPFYRLGSTLWLGYLPDEEVAAFVREGFGTAGVSLSDEAIARIFELSARVPYNIQRLSAQLFTAVRQEGRDGHRVEVADVDEALERIFDSVRQTYFLYLRSQTASRQRVLVALANETQRALPVAKLAARLGLPVSTVRSARASFLDGDVLRLPADVIRDGVIEFVDPFFERWLARAENGRLDIG